MKFWDAVEIARKSPGTVIKRHDCDDSKELKPQANFFNGELRWTCDLPVPITDHNLDAEWTVVNPEPKQYTFTEAYAMMKSGNNMKSLATGVHSCCGVFNESEIDGMWVEAE